MRIGSMIKLLLDEVRQSDLDEPSRDRLREIYETSVRELAEVRTVDQLMSLQSRLAGTQLERTMDFWNRLWRVAGDNQLAMIGQAQSQLGQQRRSSPRTSKPPARTQP
jgi:hypothetical protein